MAEGNDIMSFIKKHFKDLAAKKNSMRKQIVAKEKEEQKNGEPQHNGERKEAKAQTDKISPKAIKEEKSNGQIEEKEIGKKEENQEDEEELVETEIKHKGSKTLEERNSKMIEPKYDICP